jgi:hypothetical protein
MEGNLRIAQDTQRAPLPIPELLPIRAIREIRGDQLPDSD